MEIVCVARVILYIRLNFSEVGRMLLRIWDLQVKCNDLSAPVAATCRNWGYYVRHILWLVLWSFTTSHRDS